MMLTVLKSLGIASPARVRPPFWGARQSIADAALSSTSLTIGTGSQTLVTDPYLAFGVGQFVRIISVANAANYMEGTVASYTASSGSLTVTVTSVGGSGTISSWTVQNLDAALYGTCVLWLDASRRSSFALDTTNGTSVTQWSDLSGYNNHLMQPVVADRPVRSALRNNRSVVRFQTGTSQSMSNTMTTTAQPFTTVMAFITGGGSGTWYASASNNLAFWSATNVYTLAAPTTRGFGPPPSMFTRWYGWQVAIVYWNGAASTLSLTDGAGTVTATISASPGTNGLSSLVLGGTVRGARATNMDVAEMAVFKGALTTDNTASIIRSLRTKWGIV